MEQSLDQMFAIQWRENAGIEAEAPSFWPLCRVLSDAGLALGNREDVAAAKIGPFRIATTAGVDEVTDSFIRSSIPILASGVFKGLSVTDAIAAGLLFVFETFTATLKGGTTISNPIAWATLLHIRKLNGQGNRPTIDEVLKEAHTIAPRSDMEAVRAAIAELEAARPLMGTEPVQLLERDDLGRLLCKV